MTMTDLQQQMATAIANNDVKKMEELAGQILKGKTERIKAESEQVRKEQEALAGAREILATKIHKTVKAMKLDQELRDVKSWAFTYKVDKANPNELDIVYKAVALTTATVKAHKVGGGGGAGKSKDQFGMSLTEIFDKFATDADKADLDKATTNSAQWQVKNKVKKQAIADGKLAPVK